MLFAFSPFRLFALFGLFSRLFAFSAPFRDSFRLFASAFRAFSGPLAPTAGGPNGPFAFSPFRLFRALFAFSGHRPECTQILLWVAREKARKGEKASKKGEKSAKRRAKRPPTEASVTAMVRRRRTKSRPGSRKAAEKAPRKGSRKRSRKRRKEAEKAKSLGGRRPGNKAPAA